MNLLLWVSIIYFLTVLISWKPIHESVKVKKIEEAISPFAPEFVAFFASLIPILNLTIAYLWYRMKAKLKRTQKSINKGVFSKAGDVLSKIADNPELSEEDREMAKQLAETFKNIKSPDDLDDLDK